MTTRIFGSGIKRREDPRLITGEARYTDDIKLPGVLHMAVVRSPYAHANIVSIDSSTAEAMDGVVAVFTGDDVDLAGIPTAWLIPDSDLKTPEHPALAKGKTPPMPSLSSTKSCRRSSTRKRRLKRARL